MAATAEVVEMSDVNVDIDIDVQREGTPMVFITTAGYGGTASIDVHASGIDIDTLPSLLRVLATSIESRNGPAPFSGGA